MKDFSATFFGKAVCKKVHRFYGLFSIRVLTSEKAVTKVPVTSIALEQDLVMYFLAFHSIKTCH